MKKNVTVLQEGNNDCAAAALLSIIKYYNGFINIENIKNIINTTKTGTSAYDIIEGSKEIGFDSYAKKIKFADIEKEEELFPVIAHIKRNNMFHFVVIYKINKSRKTIEIMDPAIGYIKETYKKFEDDYLGTLIYFSKIKELPKEKEENQLFKIIINALLKNKKSIISLSILSLITFIFSLLDTIYYKIIIDNNIKSKNNIIKYLITFLIFAIIKNLFIYLRNKLSIKIEHSVDKLINQVTLNKIFSLPYSYYKNKSTGELVSRINDLETLKDLLSNLILNTFVDVLLIIISFLIMFIINKKLTTITFIILIIYIMIVKLYKEKFNTKIKLIQENKGYYNHNLIENIEGIESINNLNIKNIKIKELNNSYTETIKEKQKLNFSYNKQHFLKNVTNDLGLIILLTSGYLMVYNKIISIGDLILIYMVNNYFITIIKSILDQEINISYAFKNLSKVNNMLMSNKSERKEMNNKINGDIFINNFCFQHNSNSSKIYIKKLIIKEKEKILLTGKSGSGKSTILKVILKYLNVYKGTIKIGDKTLNNINENIIRSSFTYIGQNEKIFTTTFKQNITLNREITDYEYEKVLKICELYKIRNERKFKDNFLIEEGGFNISGGERQRIILARSLLKDSNYIFIDEALSEININLERRIMKKILEEYKDKTIIYISHKDKIKGLFKKIYNIERRTYEKF